MTETTRRLAAIAVFDIAGYSRMMAEDEDATYAAFKAHRNAIEPILLNHGGRIVKETGDGFLVEVPSAVSAVQAALDAQTLMAGRNEEAPEGRRMQFRIGVNLGDVIVADDGDIHGDGVNVAVRLEGEADPGGICVSDLVHTQIAGRVDAEFVDGGEVAVKNIPTPIHLWKTAVDATAIDPAAPMRRGAFTASIAVLPFDAMGGDDYFADGITEDLITALSRYPDFRVIARNSTFAFRGRSVDIRVMARELDATHVVEGSVRRSGQRVRVTAQLIEAETGHHLWADRFDRDLHDVFEVQDEIVREITARVHPAIEHAEGGKHAGRDPADLDAWDLLLRSRYYFYTNTREGVEEAIRLAELSAERDPSFALAHGALVAYWVTTGFNRWHIGERRAREEAARHAFIAAELDPGDAFSVSLGALGYGFAREFEQALDMARRAYALAPHDPGLLLNVGAVTYWSGEPDEAIEYLTRGWQLAQHEPWRYHLATNLAFAHYMAGRYEAAAAWVDRGLAAADYLQIRAIAAAIYAQLGEMDAARRHLSHVTAERPDQTATEFLSTNTFRRHEDVDHWKEGLVKAGMTA